MLTSRRLEESISEATESGRQQVFEICEAMGLAERTEETEPRGRRGWRFKEASQPDADETGPIKKIPKRRERETKEPDRETKEPERETSGPGTEAPP